MLAEADVARARRRCGPSCSTAIAASDAVGGHSAVGLPAGRAGAGRRRRAGGGLPGLADVLPLTPLQEGLYFHATFAPRRRPVRGAAARRADRPAGRRTGCARAADRLLDRHPNLVAAFRHGRRRRRGRGHARRPRRRCPGGTSRSRGRRSSRPPSPRPNAPHAVRPGRAAGDALHAGAAGRRPARADPDRAPHRRRRLVGAAGAATTCSPCYAGGRRPATGAVRTSRLRSTGAATGDAPRPSRLVARHCSTASTSRPGCCARRRPPRAAPRLRPGRQRAPPTAGRAASPTAAAGRAGVTVGTVLAAAWGVLVGRVTGRDDVAVRLDGLRTRRRPARHRRDGRPARQHRARAGAVGRRRHRCADVLRGFARGAARGRRARAPAAGRRCSAGSACRELFDSLVVIENYPAATARRRPVTCGSARSSVVEAPHYPLTVMVEPGRHRSRSPSPTTVGDRRVAELPARSSTSACSAAIAADATPARSPRSTCWPLQQRAHRARRRRRRAAPATARPCPTLIARRRPGPDRGARRRDRADLRRAGRARRRGSRARCATPGVRRGDVVARRPCRSAELAVAAARRSCAPARRTCPSTRRYPAARIEFMLDRRAAVLPCSSTTPAPASLPPHDLPTAASGPRPSARAPRRAVHGRPAGRGLGALHLRLDRAAQGRRGHPRARWPTGSPGRATRGRAATIRVAKSSLSFIDGTTELLGGLVAGATVVVADDDRGRRRRGPGPAGRAQPAPPSCSRCPAWPPRWPRPRPSGSAACGAGSPAARRWTRPPSRRCARASPGRRDRQLVRLLRGRR